MEIVRLTNQDSQFYSLMGPFLAKREIEKKIGHQLYDDNAKTWIIATENDVVLGFCYVWEFWDRLKCGSWYVTDDDRQNDIFKELLSEATRDVNAIVKVGTKNMILQDMLILNKFTVKRVREKFTEYEREYKNGDVQESCIQHNLSASRKA